MSYAVITGPANAFTSLNLGLNTMVIDAVPVSLNFTQVGNDFRFGDLGNYVCDLDLSVQGYMVPVPYTVQLYNVTTDTIVWSAEAIALPSLSQVQSFFPSLVVSNAAHVYRFRVNVRGTGAGNVCMWLAGPLNYRAIFQQLQGPPSSITSTLTLQNKMQAPAATPVPAVNFVSTGITLAALPSDNGSVEVWMNGIKFNLAGDRAHDFYFSDDGGATAKALNALAVGNTLYFNALIAGFSLLGTEQVDLVYCVT